ncbi:agamous-like MADS-box protein AGL61 [Vitis riparia]|uniref:agamous-like MADS-box protein AGL61 n=1 Tax=Vitis riparia TaxID=96939 RepID=UPI00155A4AB2|nr:agamous-like MADS-box protein AGL61 [Vitis riparia]
MEKKQAKSHKKVEMRRMNNEEDRLVSFSKRRSGIYRKASELSTLCGAEVGILTFSPNGKPFSFGHPCIKSITNKLLSENHTPCDGTQNLLEPYRRVRLNELHQNYKDACKQMKAAKEQEKKIKKKRLDRSKGWWEEPVIELDMDGLKQRADLIQKLHKHVQLQIKELQTMASSSTSPSDTQTNEKRIDVQPVIEQIGGIIIDGSPRLMIDSEQSLQAANNKKGKEKEVQSKGQSLLKGKSPVGKNVAATRPSKKPTEENMKRKGKEPETETTPEEAIKKAKRDEKKDKEIEKV